MTTYTLTIDTNDDGTLTEDLTADVLDIRWRLGMADPFDSLAALSWAEVVLRNPDGRYSPGNGSSALDRGHTLRVQSDDGTTTRTHFTGSVVQIAPAPGEYGPRTTLVRAEGPLRDLRENRVRLDALVNVRADEVISRVLALVPFRLRHLDGAFILGVPTYAELGVNSRLPSDVMLVGSLLETGVSTFAYVGDTWDGGVGALAAVREVTEAERGRFYVDRAGNFALLNRQHTLLDTAPVAAFTDDMDGLTLTYGDDVVSRVAVTLTPRRLGSNDDILWRLGAVQPVPAGNAPTFTAHFRSETGGRIGALAVNRPRPGVDYRVNTAPDGSGTDITGQVELRLLAADGASAQVQARSNSLQDGYLMGGAVLRGLALYTGDPLTVDASDETSATFYGAREVVFNLPGLSSVGEAQSIAQFELARRARPQTQMRSLTLTNRTHRPQILARTLFDRITLTETQTGHTGDSFIVAEAHHVFMGGTAHHVTWTLEPANPGAFWVMGVSHLEEDTHLAY